MTTPPDETTNVFTFTINDVAITYDATENVFTVRLFGGQFISPNLASVLHLAELGELIEIPQQNVAQQHRIFISGKG
jgi:hypothetical protein